MQGSERKKDMLVIVRTGKEPFNPEVNLKLALELFRENVMGLED
jgi:hypothetical protein